MIGKAYSTDLRERVIQLRGEGHSQHGIAQLLKLSVSTVKRYLVRYAATGSVAPTRQKRLAPTLGEAELAILAEQVTAHPEGTLHEHAAWFAERSGRQVSHMTIHRAFRRLGVTRKKRRWVRVNGM